MKAIVKGTPSKFINHHRTDGSIYPRLFKGFDKKGFPIAEVILSVYDDGSFKVWEGSIINVAKSAKRDGMWVFSDTPIHFYSEKRAKEYNDTYKRVGSNLKEVAGNQVRPRI